MVKKIFLILGLLFLFLAVLALAKGIFQSNQLLTNPAKTDNTNQEEILVGSHKILVQIADNPQLRAKGLGGRDSLEEEEGMLFIFEAPDFYRFWMKDMKIPLDFIWIRGDEIIDITENVPPPKNVSDYLPVYQPKQVVDKVLEVNAGWVKRHEVKIRDKIQVKNFYRE